MTDQPITHKSTSKNVSAATTTLESTNKNGVKCDWSGNSIYDDYYGNYSGVNLSWTFDWTELMNTGVDGLSGHITVTSPHNQFTPQKIDVDLTTNIQKVEKTVNVALNGYPVDFEYSLMPYRTAPIQEEVCYEEMFLPSKLNDTILLVDGKKLHVNITSCR